MFDALTALFTFLITSSRHVHIQRVTHFPSFGKRSVADEVVLLNQAHEPEILSVLLRYNPWKPRSGSADQKVKDIGGTLIQFRAATLPEALAYFRAMLGGGESSEITALLAGQLYTPETLAVTATAVSVLFARQQAHEWCGTLTWLKVALVLPLFLLALLFMFSQASNPFLYFQF